MVKKEALENRKENFKKTVEALKDILELSLEDIESMGFCPCCKRQMKKL